jgi:hypothetical protein
VGDINLTEVGNSGGGLVALNLYAGGGLFITASVYSDGSRVFVQCLGNGTGTSEILDDDGVTVSAGTRGSILAPWMQQEPSLFHRLRYMFGGSAIMKRFDDPDAIPTEDLRLRNRRGWLFASMGLGSSGSPGIVFADASGAVRVAWFQHRAADVREPDWWEIVVRGKTGQQRLNLQLRPGEPPDLALFADDIGTQYALDFGSNKLVPSEAARPAALAWLPSMQTHPQAPIKLADNRGRKLWSAP